MLSNEPNEAYCIQYEIIFITNIVPSSNNLCVKLANFLTHNLLFFLDL